jgi:hypothetical protein
MNRSRSRGRSSTRASTPRARAGSSPTIMLRRRWDLRRRVRQPPRVSPADECLEAARAVSGARHVGGSRLGREAIETAYALKQLEQAGVREFFYFEDREIPILTGVASPAGARGTYEPGPGEAYELPLGGTVRKAA